MARHPRLILPFVGVLLVVLASSGALAGPQVAVAPFSAAKRGKADEKAAAAAGAAFAEAWKKKRPDDTSLGGAGGRTPEKDVERAAAAVATGQKADALFVLDGSVGKEKKKKRPVSVWLVEVSTGEVLARKDVTISRSPKPADFAAAVDALVAAIPAPPEPEPAAAEPAPAAEREAEPAPGAAEAAPAALAPAAAEEGGEAAAASEGGGSGWLGGTTMGAGAFFLGAGLSALGAGALLAVSSWLMRDWENASALAGTDRDALNRNILISSVGSDALVIGGVVGLLVGAGLLTTGFFLLPGEGE